MSFVSGAITGGAVGAIIATLLGLGIEKIRAETTKNGDTLISGFRNGERVSVTVKNNAVVSPQFELVRITTSQTTESDANRPNFELKNESGVIKRIFTVAVVPDPTFKAEGNLRILLNEAPLFPVTNPVQGSFQDVDAINIPIPDTYGLKILPKEKIKFFIWNPSGNLIGATIAVFLGELP